MGILKEALDFMETKTDLLQENGLAWMTRMGSAGALAAWEEMNGDAPELIAPGRETCKHMGVSYNGGTQQLVFLLKMIILG